NQENLFIFQQGVIDLIVQQEKVTGVVTQSGLVFYAKTDVMTVGTFLGGMIHIGDKNYGGGRAGDPGANALAARFRALPFRIGRLKTGTPPRIDGRSIDLSGLTVQPGDEVVPSFSFWPRICERPPQVDCYITYTNEKTHRIIE